MKKFIALALIVAMLLSFAVIGTSATADEWDGTVATSFESGSGIENDPYVIKTGAQLAYLAQQVATQADTYAGKYIVLGNDINLNDQEWTPIGIYSTVVSYFAGSFDGKGYTVSGIKISNAANSTFGGLFGYVVTDGYFKNLVIADSEITTVSEGSGNRTGSAAGHIEAAEISSIIVKKDVTVTSTDSTGGVFGRIVGGEAKYIVNYATVIGTDIDDNTYAGGICGTLGGGATLSYSANHGTVTGGAFVNGGVVGLAGSNYDGCTINYCYNDGSVVYTGTGNNFAAGIVGRIGGVNYKEYTIQNTYNLGTVSKPNSGKALERIGEITGQNWRGTITLTNVYSIDIENVALIFKSTAPNTVENKSETEIKTLTNALDTTINANIYAPHYHTPTVESDDEYHWQECSDVNCGGLLSEKEKHSWGTKWEYKVKEGHAQVCTEAGCGYHNQIVTHNPDKDNEMCIDCGYSFVSYAITITVIDGHGEVTTDEYNVAAGKTVALNVTPEIGYKLDVITVNGEAINGNTFTMPEDNVVVEAIFLKSTDTSCAQIFGSVDLKGGEVKAGTYKFELRDKNGNVIGIATNDEKGEFKFKAIKYKKPGIHKYTVAQISKNASGVTLDKTVFTATVYVSYNAEADLKVVITLPKDIEFRNKYSVKSTSAKLSAKAVYDEDIMRSGSVAPTKLVLRSGSGEILETLATDANGNVNFSEVTFEKAGTYTFYVEQQKGGLSGVDYDTEMRQITVTVTDNGNGALIAKVAGNATFNNTYNAK